MNASEAVRDETIELLMDLIRIPSTRGGEGPAIRLLHQALTPFVDHNELVPIHDSIMEDPDYAFRIPGISYADRPNLECIIRGRGEGPSIVFNTHLDVVPPSEGQEDAFSPHLEHGKIYGRGACDAKGQAATLFALAKLLSYSGAKPAGDLFFHFVVEEENGGNGTLAMVRRGVAADCAVVLEPSELAVVPAVRGAVWFELKTFGYASHSGSKDRAVSALKEAVQAMGILERYHDRLLEASRGHPLFDRHEDPMPITFGECAAGKWPASVPSEATVKGVLGFLPNTDRHQVQLQLAQAIRDEGGEWLRDHFEIAFPMLNSDGCGLDAKHPLVRELVKAVQKQGASGEICAMTAACDAWFYNNQAGIPTVVFGPGSLRHAHSKDEQIRIDDIMTAAAALYDFVQSFDERELNDE